MGKAGFRIGLVSALILSMSVPAQADADMGAEHSNVTAPQGTVTRPEIVEPKLPDGLSQYGRITEAKATDIQVNITNAKGETSDRKFEKASYEKLQELVEQNVQLRARLATCSPNQDPAADRLAELVDEYHKALGTALFESRDFKTGAVIRKRQFDEKSFVALTKQIQDLIKTRGESTEWEKTTAAGLDETLSLFLGAEPKPEARKAAFDPAKDTRFKQGLEKTAKAIEEFKSMDTADICTLKPKTPAVAEQKKDAFDGFEAKKEQPKEEMDEMEEPMKPEPGPEMKEKPEEVLKALSQDLTKKLQDEIAAQTAATKKAFDALKDTMDMQLQQQKAEQLRQDQMARREADLAAQRQKMQNDLLKELAKQNNQQAKQMEKPAATPAPAPMAKEKPMMQQDPMQNMMPQQDPNQGMMAQMYNWMMQQMFSQQQQQQQQQQQRAQQPVVYQMGPSPAWNDIFRTAPVRTAPSDAILQAQQAGAIQAQTALINQLQAQSAQQFNPAMGVQGGGVFANRLFSQQAAVPTGAVTSVPRTTSVTNMSSGFEGISGPAALRSVGGNAKTVPQELRAGYQSNGLGF